jgi:hypothetical protein
LGIWKTLKCFDGYLKFKINHMMQKNLEIIPSQKIQKISKK